MSERPECCINATPKARKEHKCCECHGIINKGEIYHRISGVWCGEAMTFKRCSVCQKIADDIDAKMEREYGASALYEDGVTLGGLIEHIGEEDDGSELLRRYVNNALARGAVVRDWLIKRANSKEGGEG